MNTMDEQELMEISVLARALGWKDGSLSQFVAMRLVPVVPTKQEIEDAHNRDISGSVDKPPVHFSRDLDIPHSQQSVLTAQNVLEIIRALGLRYKVTPTTASTMLIVEGQGQLTPMEVINWLRKDIPRYATEEISGTTYRIALETLIKQLGVKT